MSMAYPGLTHCRECGESLNGGIGICDNCRQAKESKSEDKYKLIDILNKIANGELKEDYRTEIKMNGLYYRLFACQTADELLTDLFIHLNDEVELIEPQEPTDNTKIEELNVKGLCEIFEGKHTVNPNLAFSTALNKLNEVIRYINK